MAILTTERTMLRRMHDARKLALERNRSPQAFWLTPAEAAQLLREAERLDAGSPFSRYNGPYGCVVQAYDADGAYGLADLIANYHDVPVYRVDSRFIPQPSKAPDGDAIAV